MLYFSGAGAEDNLRISKVALAPTVAQRAELCRVGFSRSKACDVIIAIRVFPK